MLNLQLRKQWFRMIHDGEKFEEYREIGEYWRTRFYHAGLLDAEGKPVEGAVAEVIFTNGYNPKAPQLLARVKMRIGQGKTKWGAEPGREYYVLPILTCRRIR